MKVRYFFAIGIYGIWDKIYLEKYLEKIKGCEIPSPPSEAPISAVDTSFFFLLSLFVPLLLCYGTVDCKRERKLSNFYTLKLIDFSLELLFVQFK